MTEEQSMDSAVQCLYIEAIMKTLVLCVMLGLGLVCVAPAQAVDVYLYGGLGQANGSLNEKPGLWRQDGLPYATDTGEAAYKAGVGLRTEIGVFVEVGYVDPGTHSITSSFVKDEWYDPRGKRCVEHCEQLNNINLQNEMLGAELVVGYQRTFLDFFTPYAKGGIAGFAHHHGGTYHQWPQKAYRPVYFDPDGKTLGQNFDGMILAGVVGGGLCAGVAKVDLCGDVSYYPFLAHTANPLLDSLVITTAQVKVPLTGW